jgi:poly(hydroxyalkanoate) granule-associated protein
MATRTRKKAAKKTAAGVQQKLLDTVHQVWLAGLGAASKAQSGAPKLMEDLVAEGARVHASAVKAADEAVRSVVSQTQNAIRGRVDDAREKAADTFENLEKIFQTRVQRALQQLGVPTAKEIERLSDRVDALNANIAKLARKRPAARKMRPDGKPSAAASAVS